MSKKTAISLFICIFMLTSQALADEHFESAKKLFNAEEYQDAIRLLKKVTKEEPPNAEAWVLLGDSYGRLGKNESAIGAYQKANAIEAYKEVIRIQPGHAEAHFYLGMSYDHIGRIGYAFEHYKILKTLDEGLADKLYKIILGSS
jgi:Flp pilus assembly protein TadD